MSCSRSFSSASSIKAGVIPLHVWLPEAHPSAPTNISALMSGVLIKAGIYGLVRVCVFGLGVPSPSWGVVVILLGGLSAVLGVLYALVQHDLKRLLAYHSIENIGIILLGLGAGMLALAYGRPVVATLGISAALFHVLNHAVFKGLLFLAAGSVVTATGTQQIEKFGGLLRRMPWTGLCFLVGAMAISGLPPLNGFASEWLTFQAFLFGFRQSAEPPLLFLFPVAGALLALTTALAAACFVKAFGISFLALPQKRRIGRRQRIVGRHAGASGVAGGALPGAGIRSGCRSAGASGAAWPHCPVCSRRRTSRRACLGMASGSAATGSFDHVVPVMLGAVLVAGFIVAWAARRPGTVRRCRRGDVVAS